MLRFVLLAAFPLVAAALPSPALASDGGAGPSCEGTFSVLSPLPDACLGVIDTVGGTLNDPAAGRNARVVLLDDDYTKRSRRRFSGCPCAGDSAVPL